MGNALDFLNEHTDGYDDSVDKIEEFMKEKGTTKIADSDRNTGTHLAKYKENNRDRNIDSVRSAYHDLHILKDGVEYRLHQLTEVKAKTNGYSFRAYPTSSDGAVFVIMERQLKHHISSKRITVKKNQKVVKQTYSFKDDDSPLGSNPFMEG